MLQVSLPRIRLQDIRAFRFTAANDSYQRDSHLNWTQLFCSPCDQPFVESSTVASLAEERESSTKPIVAASYAAQTGNSVLFDRSCFELHMSLDVTPSVIRRGCRGCGSE